MRNESHQAIARFAEKFTREPSGCWSWDGASDSRYGQFFLNGKVHKAHRASWMLYNGNIPGGIRVLHRCDNPMCVNPSHLFLGTLSDNTLDCVSKGRWNRPNGIKHYCARLTETKVRFIRKSPRSCEDLSRKFSVSAQTIHEARTRKTWKHVI
jgi:hypothetical protein